MILHHLHLLQKRNSSAAASRLPKVKPIPGVKNVVLVTSAKGGVGKSTVAFNVAHGIKSQIKVTLAFNSPCS